MTGGSRVTFATGLAVVNSVRDMIRELKVRAAKIWNVDPDGVIWENGMAKPAGSNVGEFEPLTLADLAAQAGKTGGPINGHAQLNVTGAGPGFGVHCCDLKVDDDTGCVTIGRYTAAQDVGTAIHPSYVEGQLQGGAVQGIGWALNEEYIYNSKGKLANPGFLDYRMPVASDLPMIETILVEVPNPSASLRRARGRRGADRSADRRGRQRDLPRHRHPHGRPADVAAAASRRRWMRRRRAWRRTKRGCPPSSRARRSPVAPFLLPSSDCHAPWQRLVAGAPTFSSIAARLPACPLPASKIAHSGSWRRAEGVAPIALIAAISCPAACDPAARSAGGGRANSANVRVR